MKKIVTALTLLLTPLLLGTANFTSNNGILVIPDVSIDGTSHYESVTLQLNLANGTFSVLDATPKDTSFSDTALGTMSAGEIKVDFYGCAHSGHNQVTCLTKVVSPNKDASISAYAGSESKLYDDLSKEYEASSVTTLDKSSGGFLNAVDVVIIQGIPVEVKFIYDNIDPSATLISAFQPRFFHDGSNAIGNFRNIDF
ncbi:MAG: hypothetical protein E6Q62_11865 [Nitrosomonas sp.]|nr:MAG: hypothetical protein E6Q62_11865 [Nitrosomonas sp.]